MVDLLELFVSIRARAYCSGSTRCCRDRHTPNSSDSLVGNTERGRRCRAWIGFLNRFGVSCLSRQNGCNPCCACVFASHCLAAFLTFSLLLRPRCAQERPRVPTIEANGMRIRRGISARADLDVTTVTTSSLTRPSTRLQQHTSGWRYSACRPATHCEEAADCGGPITRTACPGHPMLCRCAYQPCERDASGIGTRTRAAIASLTLTSPRMPRQTRHHRSTGRFGDQRATGSENEHQYWVDLDEPTAQFVLLKKSKCTHQ